MYDNPNAGPEESKGLSKLCKYINEKVNQRLSGASLASLVQIDNILFSLISDGDAEGEIRINIVRACSDALVYATAKCYNPDKLFEGFSHSFFQKNQINENYKKLKLLINVFTGGKTV